MTTPTIEATSSAILARALASGNNRMTFIEFVNFVNIPLDGIFADRFFHTLKRDIPILMNDDLVAWFGYSGDIVQQRRLILDLLKTNFPDETNKLWWNLSTTDYKKCRTGDLATPNLLISDEKPDENPIGGCPPMEKTSLIPAARESISQNTLYPPAQVGKNKMKYLLVMPDIFKEMAMIAQTAKGKHIRKYYIQFEKIVTVYIEYQNTTIIRGKDDAYNKLVMMLQTNEQKAEEERKRAEERFNELIGYSKETKQELKNTQESLETIQEALEESKDEILEKIVELTETKQDLTNVTKDRVATKRIPKDRYNHLVILKDDDAEDDDPPYYILRTQEKSINSRIKTLKKTWNVREIFRIYTPNATKAWISIYDKYSANIRKSPTANWFWIKNISESQFKANLMKMDRTERKNPKFI